MKKNQRETAVERISLLFNKADKVALEGDLDLADEHIMSARKISSKTNVSIPAHQKRKMCKYCYCYLLPGKTSKVRINSKEKRVEVRCVKCDKMIFYPYIRELKEKRRGG